MTVAARLYELDGGARTKQKRIRVEMEPAAVSIFVPKKRRMNLKGR